MRLIDETEDMTDEQRRAVTAEQDANEHFVMAADDYETDDDFQRAVVSVIVQLIGL